MKAIEAKNLNFSYDNKLALKNLDISLKKGSRCLLVGGNGSGKTTFLKLLAGKKLCDNLLVLGKHSFSDTTLNHQRNFIDQNWGLRTVAFAGNNIPYVADIKVNEMMSNLQKEYPERRKKLLELLEINENWSMAYISDGQRRRIQIFLGLLKPVELILLDEISNVLDILCREKLLKWLYDESVNNNVTVVYATHIFDGLDNWYNDVIFLKRNKDDSSLGFVGCKDDIKKDIYSQVKEWLLNDEYNESLINKNTYLTDSTVSAGGYAPGRFYNYW